jgi:DNA polymerase III epsilon subunit family exonuclease
MPIQTFIAFDVETTGLDRTTNQIVELAGVKFTVEFNKRKKAIPITIDTFSELVKPTMRIPDDVIAIHGITNEKVENSRSIKEVLPEFFKFCGLASIMIAHNAPFDNGFLRHAIRDNNISPIGNPVLDSQKISRSIMKEAASHKLGELAKRLRREISLKLDSSKQHRALYDCEILMEIFVAILNRRLEPEEWEMAEFLTKVSPYHNEPLFITKGL